MERDIRENKDSRQLYSIGQVSKLCNISQKTLRYYDKIGLIKPDKVDDSNNYRYYSRETLLFVPVIKYYKQMGFKLEEMQELLGSSSYSRHIRKFNEKIAEIQQQMGELRVASRSIKDWRDLILEAQTVLENKVTEVSVRYLDNLSGCYMEQDFNGNYPETIINIDWTNYLEQIDISITGSVMIYCSDFRSKMLRKNVRIKVFQEVATASDDYPAFSVGGTMIASCYHIGNYGTINDTYKKIMNWAETNGYECSEFSVERFVTDFWTTKNIDEFITEVIVGIKRKEV